MYIKYLRRYAVHPNPFYYIRADIASTSYHSSVFETDKCCGPGEIKPVKNRTELALTLPGKSDIVILTPNKYLTINT